MTLLCANTFASAVEPLKLSGSTMGTYYSIVIDSPQESVGNGDALKSKVEDRLKDINRQMSNWDESSEISRFNKSTSTDWLAVSPEFTTVVIEARKIHELTSGAFDPTVAPLIDLWGFGDGRQKSIPEQSSINDVLATIGMQHLDVRTEPPGLKKSIPGLQLNLSAIAKGYGVDAVARLLESEGHNSFVVDIGGENRTGLAKASGDPWKLGIESPQGGLRRIMRLTESSIATSGDYRNFFQMNGTTYSHAINPVTGWPVKSPPASVSVVHKSCMTADAWATAMMVVGTDRGLQLAAKHQLAVMFQQLQSDNSVSEISNNEFRALPQTEIVRDETSNATTSNDEQTEVTEHSEVADENKKSNSAAWFPFAAAAVIFLVAIGGMAIGTMLQNKSLKGSCGGLASMPGSEGKSICDLCTIPKDQCTNTELKEKMQAAAAFRDEE